MNAFAELAQPSRTVRGVPGLDVKAGLDFNVTPKLSTPRFFIDGSTKAFLDICSLDLTLIFPFSSLRLSFLPNSQFFFLILG